MIFILALIYGICWSVMDDIAHHDKYAHFGYYWSREAYEDNKTSWLDNLLPMIGDGWHLLQFIRNLCPAIAIWIISGSLLLGVVWIGLILVVFLTTYNK